MEFSSEHIRKKELTYPTGPFDIFEILNRETGYLYAIQKGCRCSKVEKRSVGNPLRKKRNQSGFPFSIPTEQNTISEPQGPSIDVSAVDELHRPTNFDALKSYFFSQELQSKTVFSRIERRSIVTFVDFLELENRKYELSASPVFHST